MTSMTTGAITIRGNELSENSGSLIVKFIDSDFTIAPKVSLP